MRFRLVKTLWNMLFPKTKTNTSQPFPSIPFDGRHALPVELWDSIFLHLDDRTLFVVAAVCRTFNERSVSVALLTNVIALPGVDMAAGNYTIPSRLLPLLLRALFIPTMKNLSCIFEESNLLLQLRLVSSLVAQSSDLNSVDLQFPPMAPTHGVWPRRLLDASKHGVFRTVLSSMLSGPLPSRDIILVSEHHFVRCSTQELFEYLISVPNKSKIGPFIWIAQITSWKLYFQRTSVDGMRPFAMLVIHESTLETLTLGFRPWSSRLDDDSRLTVAHLSVMLSKLTLPHLQSLIIRTPYIDLGSLRDFLIRHPQIRSISDERPPAERDTPSPRDAFFPSSLAMPNLQRIAGENTVAVLALLVLTAPCSRCTISLTFTNFAPGAAEARASLFRYVSQRNIPTQLDICTPLRVIEPTETDLALAQILHCVDTVFISSTYIAGFKESPALLPWFNSLPALSLVGIVTTNPSEEDLTFLTLARASLDRPGTDLRVEVIPPGREPRFSWPMNQLS